MTSLRRPVEQLQHALKWAAQRWKQALLLAALLILSAEGPPPASLETRVSRRLVAERFDFAGWELKAVWAKLVHGLLAPQRYLDESARHDFVIDYLAMVADVQRLEREIHRLYTDPQVADPDAATADLRTRLGEVRASVHARQPLAEAILEEQVAGILVAEGFGVLGQEFPPVSAHFTSTPHLLVISPRDHIERIFQLGLAHGLDLARREAIEEQLDTALDVSSLVTGVGGVSAYPAMLLESTSLNWLAEATAHEWTHHYLGPRPLGWHYDAGPEARTINETVASIVGKEVGRRMVASHYAELLPPEPERGSEVGALPAEPPEFDFRTEMRMTRIRVDHLLGQGKIEEAEAYMEQRRQVFVDQGHYIRKLNQAYFAFHGAYADEPGPAGEDPIGPAVRELHARSPDLHTFVAQVARVTTLTELQALLGEMEK